MKILKGRLKNFWKLQKSYPNGCIFTKLVEIINSLGKNVIDLQG